MGCATSRTDEPAVNSNIIAKGSSSKDHAQSEARPIANVSHQPTAPPENEKKKLTDGEIRKKIQRYMDIEKEIHEWEGKNLHKALQAKKEQANVVSQALKDMEQQYKSACENVAQEKSDVDKMQNPSVRSFFKNQEEFEEKMSKEQEEYLEAVSEQEVAKKQLDGIQSQQEALEKEVQELTRDMNKLTTLYDEQDQILGDVFRGQYGSELENKLEQEMDQLLDRKERIGVAKYKWTNGRLLLQHAVNQLALAVQRWQTLAQVPSDTQIKYQLATETRNNLIAASQNIMSAKRYLNNIKFPYCEPEEIATLDKACCNVYIDMQSSDKHQHALQCYSVTYRRAAALLQWFDSVINHTIEKDLARAKADLAPKKRELRRERIHLMKQKIDGVTHDIKFSEKDINDEFDDDILEPELVAISQPDEVDRDLDGMVPLDDCQVHNPTPLPLSDLAPPPTHEDLFGNIEQLKKQHEQERAQIQKTQETNKARIEQVLQEKLQQRRTRRMRMMEGNNQDSISHEK